MLLEKIGKGRLIILIVLHMTEENILRIIRPVQWDIEYWERYIQQYENGNVEFPNDYSDEKINRIKENDLIYFNEKLKDLKKELNNLKNYYAEYLI